MNRISTLNNKAVASELDAPSGFRKVSMSEAVLTYARPFMEYVEKGTIEDPNIALQLSMMLWNYTQSDGPNILDKEKKNIIKLIKKALQFTTQQALELFDMMIERKDYLLPQGIQPDYSAFMYIRKETLYIINKFDYNSLNIPNAPYIEKKTDKEIVEWLNKMDNLPSEDFEEWEDLFYSMNDDCLQSFKDWLTYKGLEKHCEDFVFFASVFLDFIFLYADSYELSLKKINSDLLDEFFINYILRKVSTKPNEYVKAPPALKMFYTYLYEIGYLINLKRVIHLVDNIEPYYINILKEEFS